MGYVLALMGVLSQGAFAWGKLASAPKDLTPFLGCPLPLEAKEDLALLKKGRWLGYEDHPFHEKDWWLAFKDDLSVLKADFPPDIYKITVISIRKISKESYGFRYFGNGESLEPVAPWSSTKWLSALSAIRRLRQEGLSAHSFIGPYHLADLITTSHTGVATETVKDLLSNEIGTLFANLASRPLQNDIPAWLHRPMESLGGGYGGKKGFKQWVVKDVLTGKKHTFTPSAAGAKRNRFSTLAAAESLKRLVTHLDPHHTTRFPLVTEDDLKILFYGHPKRPPGGMLIAFEEPIRAGLGGKEVLDQETKGLWRIFSKTGSAHWVTGQEQILNAALCLPRGQNSQFLVFSMHVKGAVRKLGLKRVHAGFATIKRLWLDPPPAQSPSPAKK